LLHVRVRDSLVEGRRSGQVSQLSAFTVSEDAETPEMNSGSLHRYLAEAVWCTHRPASQREIAMECD
jgi:uncharacterized protein DUF6920